MQGEPMEAKAKRVNYEAVTAENVIDVLEKGLGEMSYYFRQIGYSSNIDLYIAKEVKDGGKFTFLLVTSPNHSGPNKYCFLTYDANRYVLTRTDSNGGHEAHKVLPQPDRHYEFDEESILKEGMVEIAADESLSPKDLFFRIEIS